MGYKVSKKLLLPHQKTSQHYCNGIEGIDLDKMLQDVKNAVDGISQFPADAETTGICTDI